MKVKFYITPVYPYGNDHYFHEIIAIAEGLKELGHTIFGNCDYWWLPENQEYLINGDVNNNEFDLAIYDYRYVKSFEHLLFRKGFPNFDKSKTHILIDRNDWIQPIWWNNKNYEVFDHIFAGNLYSDLNYPNNVHPWAIGLTNRIIKTIDKFYSDTISRDGIVGYNFRVDHNMRGFLLNDLKRNLKKYPASEKFTKPPVNSNIDEFYNKASTGRHNPEYYNVLCNTLFFMSYGGYYDYKPLKYQPYTVIDKLLRKPNYWKYKLKCKSQSDFSDTVFIFQHDNFRFWEVMYSGSIAINIDLNYWGFKLPAMPVEGKHYIGIKKLKDNNIESVISKLTDKDLKIMSAEARKWVFDNYSPKAQAMRILSYLKL